jgi:hypothetical protein
MTTAVHAATYVTFARTFTLTIVVLADQEMTFAMTFAMLIGVLAATHATFAVTITDHATTCAIFAIHHAILITVIATVLNAGFGIGNFDTGDTGTTR